MKTIADEIREFLEVTGSTQKSLSKASGIPSSTICNLLKGKRKHLIGPNQDSIRAAMARLTSLPTQSSAPAEGDGERPSVPCDHKFHIEAESS